MRVGDLYKIKADRSMGTDYVVKIIYVTPRRVEAKHLVGTSLVGTWTRSEFETLYEPVTKLEKYLHDYE